MGRVVTPITVTHYEDYARRRAGATDVSVRSIECEALVDSGATLLCLKRSIIDQLGLALLDSVTIQTANGPLSTGKYGPIWLEVMGRACLCSAFEVSETTPNLLGQVPLEELDYVVDLKRQRLIGNPEHGGVQSGEIY